MTLESILFWLGMVGLISGIMVGLSLLEDGGDRFVRSIMFAIGIACATFGYLSILGQESAWGPRLLLISLAAGGAAGLLLAYTARGNWRAAFIAGAFAAEILQLLTKILPPGSLGISVPADLAGSLDFLITFAAGIGTYYLLRNWGKDREKWD